MAQQIRKKQKKSKTQDLYDRIADVQNLAMKINGYRDSVAKYLSSLDLEIKPDSLVLDAGSGTGLVTSALYSANYRPQKTFTLDLSFNSLKVSREQFSEDNLVKHMDVEPVQGNLLALPFQSESFDVVLTCGALEYVPLDAGLQELARVLKKDGTLVLIPVRPSLVSSFLEVLYNFKTHSLDEVRETSRRYFQIIGNYKFPITEPIGWSKMLFLLQKK